MGPMQYPPPLSTHASSLFLLSYARSSSLLVFYKKKEKVKNIFWDLRIFCVRFFSSPIVEQGSDPPSSNSPWRFIQRIQRSWGLAFLCVEKKSMSHTLSPQVDPRSFYPLFFFPCSSIFSPLLLFFSPIFFLFLLHIHIFVSLWIAPISITTASA